MAFYDEYLQDIYEEQRRSPYRESAKRTIGQISPGLREHEKRLEELFRRGDISPEAKAEQARKLSISQAETTAGILGAAEERDIQRAESLRAEARNIELEQKRIDEQKKAQEEAKKQQWWQTGAQVLGAGAGFLLGGTTGALIGSALGGLTTGIAFDSPEQAMVATGDVIAGLAQGQRLKSKQKQYDVFQQAWQGIDTSTEQGLQAANLLFNKFSAGLLSEEDLVKPQGIQTSTIEAK